MRTVFALLAIGGAAAWIAALQRRLNAAQMRGDMYRDIAVRLDRQLAEHSARGN